MCHDQKSKSDKDLWDELSESQKQHINEGIEDEEAGRVISSEEFWDVLKNGRKSSINRQQ